MSHQKALSVRSTILKVTQIPMCIKLYSMEVVYRQYGSALGEHIALVTSRKANGRELSSKKEKKTQK